MLMRMTVVDVGMSLNQSDFPPAFPAWFGSPTSLVALRFDAVAEVLPVLGSIVSVCAPEKLSFAGAPPPPRTASAATDSKTADSIEKIAMYFFIVFLLSNLVPHP